MLLLAIVMAISGMSNTAMAAAVDLDVAGTTTPSASLDYNDGTGALTGATTIDASGTITGGTITDGTASMTNGAISGISTLGATTGDITTVNSATLQNGSNLTIRADSDVGNAGVEYVTIGASNVETIRSSSTATSINTGNTASTSIGNATGMLIQAHITLATLTIVSVPR
ncbi:MAG: hypothetical protein MZW92_32640 [Comamonadaceae bacterium]|nr:hypothetical protein [Comamonadaceae bacterium]